MPTHAIASSGYIDALSDLILNSRLPVGLIAIGIPSLPELDIADAYKEGLLRMRRLGVLLHFMNFTGAVEQLHWINEMQIEGIHIDVSQLRNEALSHDVITQLKQSPFSPIQIYASNVSLVKDLENATAMHTDHCYGSLMLSPLSRHQILQINDSRIAKAIFSLHPHPQPNQNGDK
jgi:hypothetical protein